MKSDLFTRFKNCGEFSLSSAVELSHGMGLKFDTTVLGPEDARLQSISGLSENHSLLGSLPLHVISAFGLASYFSFNESFITSEEKAFSKSFKLFVAVNNELLE